jgi:two-component system sensor histidine kinase KdpD
VAPNEPGLPSRVGAPGGDLILGHCAAASAVALITALIHFVRDAAHLTNISLLYLLAVIGTALRFGRASAVAAAVLAFLAFDFCFTEPYHTFTVHDPAEWLALCMFLVTAIVTGQLTALLRARADEARQREREAEALVEASWAVASQVDRDRALSEVLRRLLHVVNPRVAAIVVPEKDQLVCAARFERKGDALPRFGEGSAGQAVRFVLEHRCSIGWKQQSRHWQKALADAEHPDAIYLPLTAENRTLGVLYLRPSEQRQITPRQQRVVESLANHAAVVLERDELARAETRVRALAEADRLKTALLSMVSHDFRTPLASIKASATALLEGGAPVDAETLRELLTGIDREADRLNRVVGNILALSRLEADAWRPQVETIDPTELVGSALQSFGPEQNRRIQVQLDPALAEVCLDPVQIVQVLHNLLDNALKYSPDGAPVELRVQRSGGDLVMEVLDRGPGLPPGEEPACSSDSTVPRVCGRAPCRALGSALRYVTASWKRTVVG